MRVTINPLMTVPSYSTSHNLSLRRVLGEHLTKRTKSLAQKLVNQLVMDKEGVQTNVYVGNQADKEKSETEDDELGGEAGVDSRVAKLRHLSM